MLPVFKPTAKLKICGDLPQSLVRGLELDPESLLVPSNQLKLESFCFTGHGVAFGARALLRAEVTRVSVEVPISRLCNRLGK